MDFPKQESTEPSFLLHASVGADDNKCVPASGLWPTNSISRDDDAVGRIEKKFKMMTILDHF